MRVHGLKRRMSVDGSGDGDGCEAVGGCLGSASGEIVDLTIC